VLVPDNLDLIRPNHAPPCPDAIDIAHKPIGHIGIYNSAAQNPKNENCFTARNLDRHVAIAAHVVGEPA
jgi:hypothetical protein